MTHHSLKEVIPDEELEKVYQMREGEMVEMPETNLEVMAYTTIATVMPILISLLTDIKDILSQSKG